MCRCVCGYRCVGQVCRTRELSFSDVMGRSFWSNLKKGDLLSVGGVTRSGTGYGWPSWKSGLYCASLSCGLWTATWRPQTCPPCPGWTAWWRWSVRTLCLWKRWRIQRVRRQLGGKTNQNNEKKIYCLYTAYKHKKQGKKRIQDLKCYMSLHLSYNLKRTLSKCVSTSSRWSGKTQPATQLLSEPFQDFYNFQAQSSGVTTFFSEITLPPHLHHFVPVCFHATSCLCANWAYSDSSRHEMHRKIVSFTFKEPESELWPTYLICCHHQFVLNSSRLHPRLCHLQEETRVRVRFGKKASFNVFSRNQCGQDSKT